MGKNIPAAVRMRPLLDLVSWPQDRVTAVTHLRKIGIDTPQSDQMLKLTREIALAALKTVVQCPLSAATQSPGCTRKESLAAQCGALARSQPRCVTFLADSSFEYARRSDRIAPMDRLSNRNRSKEDAPRSAGASCDRRAVFEPAEHERASQFRRNPQPLSKRLNGGLEPTHVLLELPIT